MTQAENGTQSTESGNSAISSPDSPSGRRRILSAAEQTAAVANLLAEEGVEVNTLAKRPGTTGDRAETVLDGRRHDDNPGDDEPPQPAPRRKKPGSLVEGAQELGMSPEEVYAWEIGFGDGTPAVSLSALKDGHQNRHAALQEIAAKEAAFFERESAIRTRETEVDTLRELMLDRLSPESRAQVDRAIQQRRQREDAQAALELRRVMPELQDKAYLEGFLGHLEGVATRHRFRPEEMLAIRDPRIFTVLKELKDLQDTITRLSKIDPERVKEQPRVIQPQGRGGGDDGAIQRAKRSGREMDKVNATYSILRGR